MVDVGRLLRLKGAVDAAASAEVRATSSAAMSETYGRLRHEAREVAAELELTTEFDRLFPDAPGHGGDVATGFDPIKAEGDAKQAALLLRKLGGWLAGVAESEVLRQRQAAEAEAKARREAKPKTGFRASDTT